MYETMILVIVGVISGTVLGFWLGRVSAKYYVGDMAEEQRDGAGAEPKQVEAEVRGKEVGKVSAEYQENKRNGRNRLWYERREIGPNGVYPIGSPVSGVVTDCDDGKYPTVILYPAEEKVYAPAGGKVLKIFPLRNEMLFRTEEGPVLRMIVGDGVGELQGEYFRLKVIQNEVVNKGKLLMEFDKRALEEEGVECLVSVQVEETGLGDNVSKMAAGRVKVGETIFEISGM